MNKSDVAKQHVIPSHFQAFSFERFIVFFVLAVHRCNRCTSYEFPSFQLLQRCFVTHGVIEFGFNNLFVGLLKKGHHMKNWYDKNISFTDCAIRYVLSGAVILGVIMLYLEAWVSLISAYLIATALLCWDPFYWLLTYLKSSATVKATKAQMRNADQNIN